MGEDSGGESSSDDEELDDAEMGDVGMQDAASEPPAEPKGPIVDDDGFELVQSSKGRRGRK